MDDKQIIDLYWTGSESAIAETDKKYGKSYHRIAFDILENPQDSEECMSEGFNPFLIFAEILMLIVIEPFLLSTVYTPRQACFLE